MSPPLLHLLREMAGAWRVEELLARAVALGAAEADARALLADLYAAGVLVDADAHARLKDARETASVLISGDGPLAAGVASALAAAGVCRLNVAAEGVVEAAEVGGFAAADVGRPRAAAAQEVVRRVAPSARVRTGPPHRRPDLAVLVDQLRPDPERHPTLASRGVPRLVVRVSDGIGLVGPLVLAGRSTCLRCIDLHRAARDRRWPTVVAGLTGRVGSASPATTMATAALAAEQALLVLDSLVIPGQPPPTLDAVLELDARRGELHRRGWAPHSDCDCGAAHIRREDRQQGHSTRGEVSPKEEPRPGSGRLACEEMAAQ